MCTGPKTKTCSLDLEMEGSSLEKKDGVSNRSCPNLLELSASGDLTAFVFEVEQRGFDVDGPSFWYGRRFGSKKMGFEERTPLLIASLYGSTEVVKYIVGTGKADVNRKCGSDGATALHCAVAGGSDSSVEVVKVLIGASARIDLADGNGNRPCDVIPRYPKSSMKRKMLEILLKDGSVDDGADVKEDSTPKSSNEGSEKREYPIDVSLPDINSGIYGTDEFRMYSFKVKPCSRAYSHDWTECPFVHPGENARRRDPRKNHYTCVPCPEFKKGTCAKGDNCEYAHGVFESWLHPAQYRTRLCKDEVGCARKVCFFAHKPEELRPLYASTGSGIPSPKSTPVSSMDVSALSLASSPLMMPATPPMSPSTVASSSPMGGSMWQNKMNLTPPALQLPGSRLKTAVNARDFDLEMELLGLGSVRTQQQRQLLMDEMSGLSSPSNWNKEYHRLGDLKPTNLDDVFGSIDPSMLSQLQSPTGHQIRQNISQLRASYPSNAMSPSAYGFDSSAAVAAAVMNARSAAFAKRSQSFIDRGGMGPRSGSSQPMMSSNLSEWSSPDGKLDWGFSGEDLSKLRRSASFGFRGGNTTSAKTAMAPSSMDEPDVSWVHSLVKDASSTRAGLYSEQMRGGVHDSLIDQMYREQEQIVA